MGIGHADVQHLATLGEHEIDPCTILQCHHQPFRRLSFLLRSTSRSMDLLIICLDDCGSGVVASCHDIISHFRSVVNSANYLFCEKGRRSLSMATSGLQRNRARIPLPPMPRLMYMLVSPMSRPAAADSSSGP